MNIFTGKQVVSLVSVLALAGLVSGASSAADFPAAGDFQRGAKTWADNCGRCHNIRGARELRDDQWISTVFHMRIRAGLTGQETRDVLTFLQASNSSAVATIPPTLPSAGVTNTSEKSGEAIFRQTCIACHGSDGRGALPGVPDFTDKQGPLTKSDEMLIKHITEGFQTPGSPMAMPPKGGNPSLSTSDIKTVINYLRKTYWK